MTAAHRRARGFTLIELLIVIALIAGLSAFLIGGWHENNTASLQTAQAAFANMLSAARTRAMASGCRVRLLIHADARAPARFRRVIAMQQEWTYLSDDWRTTAAVVTLPAGVIVLPYQHRIPSGLYETPGDWVKTSTGGVSGTALHSSSLYAAPVIAAVESASAEAWDLIQFTPDSSLTTGMGDVVLASVRGRPPGSYSAGDSPVRAESPDRVRGITLSIYGVPALINSRAEF